MILYKGTFKRQTCFFFCQLKNAFSRVPNVNCGRFSFLRWGNFHGRWSKRKNSSTRCACGDHQGSYWTCLVAPPTNHHLFQFLSPSKKGCGISGRLHPSADFFSARSIMWRCWRTITSNDEELLSSQYINSAGHSSQRTDVFLSVRWIRMDSLDPLPSPRGLFLFGVPYFRKRFWEYHGIS